MISQEFDPVIVKVLCDTQFTMYKYPRCGKCEKYHKTQQPHVLKKGKVEVVKGIFFASIWEIYWPELILIRTQ